MAEPLLPKVLVVDDTPANLFAMRLLLSGVRAEIVEADSGATALALFMENDFALALIDVHMPGMDGFEVAELLGGIERTRQTPIIFVTAAHGDALKPIKGYDAGAVDYIQKPVDDRILLSKVGVFLELHNRRREQEHLVGLLTERGALLEREVEQRRLAEAQLCRHRDELDRRVAERTRELQRANRALRVLNACNEALLEARNETELVAAFMGILVARGEFAGAWVARDETGRDGRPAALCERLTWGELEGGWLCVQLADGDALDAERASLLKNLAVKLAHGLTALGEAQRRKRAETALAESEERLRSVVRNMPVMLVAFDEEERFAVWNRECQRVTGFAPEAIVGQVAGWDRLHPDGEERRKVREKWLSPPCDFREEMWSMACKDGGERITAWSSIADQFPIPGWRAWGIGRDVTHHKAMEEALVASREQLRELAGHLEAVREEERRWLSQEIHDELGSNLAHMKMNLLWLRRHYPEGDDQHAERLDGLLRLLEGTIERIRSITHALRPPILDQFGLAAALEWLVEQFEKNSGLGCLLRLPTPPPRFDTARETALFHICQETLTNVLRHAGAETVEIVLTVEKEQVRLSVWDDGRGFPGEALDGRGCSLGLLGMTERARRLGGSLVIDNPESGGARLVVLLPMHREVGTA